MERQWTVVTLHHSYLGAVGEKMENNTSKRDGIAVIDQRMANIISFPVRSISFESFVSVAAFAILGSFSFELGIGLEFVRKVAAGFVQDS